MAGNYPDVPSWRMAYDRDGTQGFNITPDLATIAQLTSVQMQGLNDENPSTAVYMANGYIAFLFPELRDLDGVFWVSISQVYGGVAASIEVSANTTNGVDGSWAQVRASGPDPGALQPGYRASIISTTSFGIRGVRFKVNQSGGSHGFTTIHLYGEPIPGANPNRLEIWHPTLDQRTIPAYFDWGDTPRSSSADKPFRVKNLSGSQTASSVRVAQEMLTDAPSPAPSVVGQHTLSADGGTTFLPQVNVGTLAPGAISSIVTIRRNTPSNAQLGLWAPRLFAEANSWS